MELKDIKKFIIVIEQEDTFYQGKGTYTLGSDDYYDEIGSNEWVNLKDLKEGKNTINDIELFNTEADAIDYWKNWRDCMYFHFGSFKDYLNTNFKVARLCDVI